VAASALWYELEKEGPIKLDKASTFECSLNDVIDTSMTLQSIFSNEFNVGPSDQLDESAINDMIMAAQDQGLQISQPATNQLQVSLCPKTIKPLKFMHRLL